MSEKQKIRQELGRLYYIQQFKFISQELQNNFWIDHNSLRQQKRRINKLKTLLLHYPGDPLVGAEIEDLVKNVEANYGEQLSLDAIQTLCQDLNMVAQQLLQATDVFFLEHYLNGENHLFKHSK